jgi:hypothetical protein
MSISQQVDSVSSQPQGRDLKKGVAPATKLRADLCPNYPVFFKPFAHLLRAPQVNDKKIIHQFGLYIISVLLS